MISCISLLTPPKDERAVMSEAVLAYGRKRRGDGSIDGEEIGYRAKDLASDIQLGQPIHLTGHTMSLLYNALFAAGRGALACRMLEACNAASALNAYFINPKKDN
jgi:hypothetical protein